VTEILDAVREAVRKKVLFLPHAIKQMAHPSTMISTSEVERVVVEGEIIEDYPEDVRGPSCLITAYVPDPSQWSPDFRRRVP
jgi:hypothetical protein